MAAEHLTVFYVSAQRPFVGCALLLRYWMSQLQSGLLLRRCTRLEVNTSNEWHADINEWLKKWCPDSDSSIMQLSTIVYCLHPVYTVQPGCATGCTTDFTSDGCQIGCNFYNGVNSLNTALFINRVYVWSKVPNCRYEMRPIPCSPRTPERISLKLGIFRPSVVAGVITHANSCDATIQWVVSVSAKTRRVQCADWTFHIFRGGIGAITRWQSQNCLNVNLPKRNFCQKTYVAILLRLS